MAKNHLVTILDSETPDLGPACNLISLDLSSNCLSSLPAEILNFQSLKVLDLASNFLAEIPPELFNLTALEFLSFSNNSKLTSLPDQLRQLQRWVYQ